MFGLILTFISSIFSAETPVGRIETGTMEAVFIPADWTGPVVAAPFDEIVFEVADD